MAVSTISILGCGWLGLSLGRRLVDAGYAVRGSTTTRTKLRTLQDAQITPHQLELSPTLSGEETDAFFASDVLVLNVPPPRGRSDLRDYHLRQIESVRAAAVAGAVEWVLFASSTGVYPRMDRAVTEDDTPDEAARAQLRPTGAALLDAEQLLQDEPAFDTTVIRFAGLYGENRDPGRFFAGRDTIPGGDAPVNLIHRDDGIGIVMELLDQNIRNDVFNACADTHPTRRTFYTAAAQRLGQPVPAFEEGGMNKRVSNDKVKRALNYTFLHPDPLKDVGSTRGDNTV